MFVYDIGLWLASRNRPFTVKQYDEYGLEIGERVEDKNLEKRFHSAANFIQSLAGQARLPQDELLYFYSRYKQATCGPASMSTSTNSKILVSDERPSFFDFKARKKFDEWHKLGVMYRANAMQQYVAKVVELNLGWDPDQTETEAKSGGFGMRPSRMHISESETTSSDDPLDLERLLFVAVKEGDIESVREILSECPELVNIRDMNHMTLLHWAADMGLAEVADTLIQNGADINAQDDEGQTPLHYAVSCTYTEVTQTLLDFNADPTIADNQGNTPQSLAEDEENDAIKEIFERHMSHV